MQNVKELVLFAVEFAEAIIAAAEDKKITLSDIVHFWPAAKALKPAIEGIEHVPSELADLSAEEARELVDYMSQHFDAPDELAEDVVERAFEFAPMLVLLVQAIKRLKRLK